MFFDSIVGMQLRPRGKLQRKILVRDYIEEKCSEYAINGALVGIILLGIANLYVEETPTVILE